MVGSKRGGEGSPVEPVSARKSTPGCPAVYRREASRTRPGHGLGLSLVAAIADLRDARLAIGDGQGFTIALLFPVKPQEGDIG